jgi:hypothetical protein
MSPLRKHPEVLALTAICLALFANIGVHRVAERVQGRLMQRQDEIFRVRQLVDSELRRQEPVLRDGILNLRDALRCLRP